MIGKKNPFLVYVDDFEEEAEKFLSRYGCAQFIDNPHPIPIYGIATKLMSLDVVCTECLSLDGSVQGAITFTEGVIDVFDWESEEYIGYRTDGPSILVDSEINSPGRINNTLAHECYHWWKHRNYFTYNRTHGHSAEFGIKCDKKMPRGYTDQGKWTDIEIMEYQARTIAPKILMPRNAIRKKVSELYSELEINGQHNNKYEVTEVVVNEIARFFRVSKQSAAIRMLELGFNEAERFCASDVTPTQDQPKRRRTNAYVHQQPISEAEAFNIFLRSDFFRTTIDTGAFCFANGYFVLRDDKYVKFSSDEGYSLTDYAKNNLHECTLDFSKKLIAEPYLIHDATAHMMYRSDTVFNEKVDYETNPQNTELYNKGREFEEKYKAARRVSKTSNEMLLEYANNKKWNSKIFQDKTQLDAINYTRLQDPEYKFTFRPLITIGFALGLDTTEMDVVLNAAGLSFKGTDKTIYAYRYIFTAFPDRDIEECNEFLIEQGVKPLGSVSRYQKSARA